MPRQRNDSEIQKKLGNRLAQARRARGLTQEALAATLEIEPATLSRYEQGRVPVTVPLLIEMAGVLGVSPASLLDVGEVQGEEEVLRLVGRLSPEAREGLVVFLRGLVG